jgi:hypothetical protein
MVGVMSDQSANTPIVKWIPTPLAVALRSMRAIRLRPLLDDDRTAHTQLRLGVRFTDKVLAECERLGITLKDETNSIDLPSLMREASMELGVHNSSDINRMSRWAYSWFLRATACRISV